MEEIEYISSKTMISSVKNNLWFGTDYNMNIYRGCNHGCIYCDSRSECYKDNTFDKIKVKENALELIEKELKKKRRKGVIATGSMSDPYNPLEEKLELTRSALKLIDSSGYGVSIATKSPLVLRDIDVLNKIRRHSPVIVKITITTENDELAKKIEPNVTSSSERFSALKKLSEEDIFCGILLMPVLPFINDNSENINAIIKKAVISKVRFIYPAFGVTLRDRQREYYYQKLDELFIGVKQRYINTYGNQYGCGSLKAKELSQNLMISCQLNSILYNMEEIIRAYKRKYETEQLNMF